MKRLLLIMGIVALAGRANATNYYVSSTGNDAAAGTSPATAWKSLTKVNAATFAANDSILFKRGDVFFGAVNVNRNNLNFSAYGTGARPLISGFVTLSGWTLATSGVYQAAVNAKSNLNMVTLNGRPQQIGRYPNASDANRGYLMYDATTANTVTDNEMTSLVNWTGAEIAIRKNGFVIDRGIITNHSGTTFTYRMAPNINSGTTPQLSPAKPGHGYFIMDDPRTLDQFGEWYFDTVAKKLLMYFGTNTPSNYNIRVSVVDTLMNIGARTNISVSNINFEGGNKTAVFSMNGGYITVKNCDMENMGGKGVQIFSSNDVLVESVNTKNILSNGIQVSNSVKPNVTIRNCRVTNTGQYAGMGSFYDVTDYRGISVTVSNNALIEYNVVDTVGFAGIHFTGSDITIQNNLVNYFCYRIHDNGGIYTWVAGTEAAPGAYYTNRTLKNNIVMNGIGAPEGTNSALPFVAGIYLDGRTMNVNVLNNTVFNSAKNGIHCNNPSNINIRGNTFFNNLQDISFMRWSWGAISNLNIKKNVSFPYSETQRNIYYTNSGLNTPVATTIQDNVRSLGSIDSNYYNTFSGAGFNLEIYSTDGGAIMPTSPYSLDAWRALSNYDAKSKRPAQKIQTYSIANTIGSNLFANSQFSANISNITLFGTNTTAAFDNSSKITGTGSLRMDFAVPTANRYGTLHSPIGAVNSTKKYLLRFKTLGTTVNGMLNAYIRKTASPYTSLVPKQTKAFGPTRTVQEFIFEAPISDAGASFVIEIDQMSGTTYVDDIEFFEVNATVNTPQSQIRFEYNATNSPRTVILDAKYVGVDSTVYNGTITLAPFTSQVLIKGGPIDSLPVASAGADKIIFLPTDSVTLAGIGSGSTIAGFTWTKISGPAQFSITAPGSATTKVRNLTIGTYRFELRVTDNRGLSGTDTLSVIVSSVLPVKLLRFAAVKDEHKVDLKWTTTSEVNSKEYVIERKVAGRDFAAIGTVAALNNDGLNNSYSLVDYTPAAGTNHYRIKMIDLDGTFTYSNIISINFFDKQQSFAVEQAAMSAQSIRLSVNSTKQQTLQIVTVDAAGRIILRTQVQLQAGNNRVVNDVRAVNKGIYYIKMFTEEESVVKTVLSE